MASISNDKGGKRRVCFTSPDGSRQSLYLGKIPRKSAESIKLRVEEILQDRAFNRSHSSELANWIAGLSATTAKKMVGVGLIAAAAPTMTVEALIETFLSRSDVKKSTQAAYQQTTTSLIKVLGGKSSISSIGGAEADAWRAACVAEGLARATIAKRTNVAKSIFKKAVSLGVLTKNPFDHLRVGSQVNAERSVFVSRSTIADVLRQCPDAKWRAIIGLTRFAGLRCPSELQELKWSDVDWDKKLLVVRSSKTEHHEGGGVRLVPVAPELQPILFDLFDNAAEGDVLLFPNLGSSSGNLRTTFHKLITRAGHTPWPRLFQNLRGSCETDWVDLYPSHQVASWLGHSPSVAARHYLKSKDLHVQAAVGPGAWIQERNAESNALLTQNTTQHPAAPLRTISQNQMQVVTTCEVVRDLAVACTTLRNNSMGDKGLEPSTSRV